MHCVSKKQDNFCMNSSYTPVKINIVSALQLSACLLPIGFVIRLLPTHTAIQEKLMPSLVYSLFPVTTHINF